VIILYNYQRIKNLREDNDLTQEELATLLKTTQQQYSKYELGIQEIPVHHLITLADYYKISIDYILNRTNNKKLYK
jgi:transcriptional regulator with XRE-family HTH domain